MRNLLQHPATLPEVIAGVERAARDARDAGRDAQACGDMRPLLLDKAAVLLRLLHSHMTRSSRSSEGTRSDPVVTAEATGSEAPRGGSEAALLDAARVALTSLSDVRQPPEPKPE